MALRGRYRNHALRGGGAAAARILSVIAAVLAAHGCGTEYGECEGETQPCENRLFADNCSTGDGCTWGTQCTPIDCNSLTANQCTFPQCRPGSLDACSWADSFIGLPDCAATVTTNCLPRCADVTQSNCSSVPGCAWRTACTGHVIGQCSDVHDEGTCRRVFGCSWNMHSTAAVG
jgi:hypothetical protein